MQVVSKSLTLQGFLTLDSLEMTEPFRKEVTEWLKSGRIQYRETIATGIENTPQAILDVLTGKNFGKQVVKVADF
jgi:NADPH-dependent curcumin reductase CurA